MRLLIKLFLVWGVFDSFWLARNPKSWESFWVNKMDAVTDRPLLARALAGLQMAMCAWLLKRL